jgi:hypothetical protein
LRIGVLKFFIALSAYNLSSSVKAFLLDLELVFPFLLLLLEFLRFACFLDDDDNISSSENTAKI